MKKILFFVCFILVSTNSHAYYGETSYSGFTLFLALLMVVWGVLNIILFFKLWKATNNIEKITQKVISNKVISSKSDLDMQLFLLKTKGQDEEAIKLLNDTLEDSITKFINNNEVGEIANTIEVLDNKIKDIIASAEPYYKLFGMEVPSYFYNINYSNLHTYKMCVKD